MPNSCFPFSSDVWVVNHISDSVTIIPTVRRREVYVDRSRRNQEFKEALANTIDMPAFQSKIGSMKAKVSGSGRGFAREVSAGWRKHESDRVQPTWKTKRKANLRLARLLFSVSLVVSNFGGVISLDGIDDILVAESTIFPNSNALQSFTVEAWINPARYNVTLMADDAYDLTLYEPIYGLPAAFSALAPLI